MIFNQRTLRDLEFGKIKDQVKQLATSNLGKEWIEKTGPSLNLSWIKNELARIEDIKWAIQTEGFSITPIKDLSSILNQTQESTSLAPEDLYTLFETLRSSRLIKEEIYELGHECPKLLEMAKGIGVFRELEERISATIDEKGEIRDTASPTLKELVNKKRDLENVVREKLQSFLESSKYSHLIRDKVITRRSSRLVIPIKKNYAHDIDLVVHGDSSTGQTLYVEPTSVVQDNNKIRELESEIRNERIRILKSLTGKVKKKRRAIQESQEKMAFLDSLYARAQYALERDCSIPQINKTGHVQLIDARHPLLKPEEVVPITISFGSKFQGALITGPNTGGKTVSLKTVGLLTLMIQSGMQIPASCDSKICVFEKVRSDIGEEQSIEQSLSTFSSHMKNIVNIIKEVDQKTLVLLDELGAGTDPQEGAALGIGILNSLLQSGAKIFVSTHSSALKKFAYRHPELKSCSVDFDTQTLSPTYHILQGVPGSSNAYIIAEKLGLPKDILNRAKEVLAEGEVKAEDIIRDLQMKSKEISQKEKKLKEDLRQVKQAKSEYQRKRKLLEKRKEKVLSDDLLETERFSKKAKAKIEKLLSKARKESDEQKIKSSLHQLMELETRLDKQKDKLDEKGKVSTLEFDQLEVGDKVLVKEVGKVGTIKEIENVENIEVEIEGIKLSVQLSDLRRPPKKRKKPGEADRLPPYIAVTSTSSPPLELSVRGLTVNEALRRVDEYLDRLLINNVRKAHIVHGKGTGTLRRAIREHLSELDYVKNYYSPPPKVGGRGVTVLELK